jgi:hypothetical protein
MDRLQRTMVINVLVSRLLVLGALVACGDTAPSTPAAPIAAVRDAAVSTARSIAPHACTSCPPQLITTFPAKRIVGLAIDDDGYAYATELFGNQIFKVKLEPGATPALLYRSPSQGTWSAAILGDDLLWSSMDTGRIYAAPRSGAGPIRVVADNLVGIGWFRIDGDALYWSDTSGSAPGTIWKRPLHGGPSVALAAPAPHTQDLLVDHGDVLAADDGHHIFRVAPDGKVTTWFEGVQAFRPSGLAADDRFVYATGTVGAVVRIDRASGDATYLLDDPGGGEVVGYQGVALHGDRVYFLSYVNPALLSLPR